MRVFPQQLRSVRQALTVGLVGIIALTSCSPSSPTSPAPTASPEPSRRVDPELSEVAVAVPDGLSDVPFDQPRKALIPNGWSLAVWARIPRARLAAWAPDGRLLVSVPSTGQVIGLQPTGDTARQSVLLDGLDQPHGLAFAGGVLYVAESDQVDAYDYADSTATNRRVVAAALPDARSPELGGAYAHALKSVTVGTDGAVYFSIGSTGNISGEDREANPPRASIMRVPPRGGSAVPFATGVRNGTGLAIAPDGALWTTVNNRDNVAVADGPSQGQVVPDYVNERPRESIAKVTPQRELGWPYCNPDGGPDGLPLIRDVQTNGDGSRLDCSALPPIEQSMGAHSAPLGMSFVDGQLPPPYARGALVGVHGSWNRQPPRAPEVSFFPWADGNLGDQQTLVGGFQFDDGSRWGRPVGAVVGPDGAVYITDDYAGAVYRLSPPGR